MTFFGSKGTAHIGSEDFAAFVNSLHGGDAIFSIEDNMECTMTDANTASIALGACVLQGYFYHHEEVDDLEVASGSIGYNRHDLVVATYTLGTDTNGNAVQDVYLRVIQGTATVGEASDPAYADGDIAGGDTLVDFPLYRLTIEGVSTPVVERIMALEAPIQSQVDANASAITALGESVSQSSFELPLSTLVNAYVASLPPMVYKFGSVVQVVGDVSPKTAVAAGASMTIGTLPPGYRPRSEVTQICQGSTNYTWLFRIYTDGTVTAARYRSGGTSAEMPTTAWLVFSATFIV